jgi:hypothetical protein
MNGFRLDNALIPVNDIRKGGPPRDGNNPTLRRNAPLHYGSSVNITRIRVRIITRMSLSLM